MTTSPSAIEQAIELQHNQGYLKFAESARQELAELRRDLEEAESDVQRLHLECAASNSERDSLREMLAVAEDGLKYYASLATHAEQPAFRAPISERYEAVNVRQPAAMPAPSIKPSNSAALSHGNDKGVVCMPAPEGVDEPDEDIVDGKLEGMMTSHLDGIYMFSARPNSNALVTEIIKQLLALREESPPQSALPPEAWGGFIYGSLPKLPGEYEAIFMAHYRDMRHDVERMTWTGEDWKFDDEIAEGIVIAYRSLSASAVPEKGE